MSDQTLALYLALGATLSFASSSLVFAEYSRRVSVLWMNSFKALVSFIALLVAVPLISGWHPIAPRIFAGFALSGLLGLNIGDLFLLSAFTRLGASRTLILFGFQPLFVGVAAYFLFDQELNPQRFLAVFFLIGCLVTFSLERYRQDKRWEIRGLVHALIGVGLDTCGILLSRGCFAANPDTTPLEGQMYRCIGALAGFVVISFFRPLRLFENLKQWTPKIRSLIIAASFAGTFVSLSFYLTAIKIGHLASIAGVAITGPMFAASLESIVHRRWPSRYLTIAFLFFCAGFYILLTVA